MEANGHLGLLFLNKQIIHRMYQKEVQKGILENLSLLDLNRFF